MSEQEHGPRTVETVLADRLYAYCQGRGWSAQTLSDEIAKLGGHLGRATISKIWNGDRAVTVDEWLLLAAALRVPPTLLLFPVGEDPQVAVTPEIRIHPHLAHKWAAGAVEPPVSDREGEWRRTILPLRLHEQLDDLDGAVRGAERRVRHARLTEDSEAEREASREYWASLEDYYRHLRSMQDAGVDPPAANQNRARDMGRLGLDLEGLPVMSDEEMEAARTWGDRKLDWPEPVDMEE